MKGIYIIISLLIFTFMLSCGSKKVVVDNSPTWVKIRPLSEVDYVGIGKSSKIKSPYKYLQLAKNNALGDISSEISVNISSSSVLSSVETQQGFVDTYSSLIKSKAQNSLEGYELVSAYETETDYWCYYKLNKEKYNTLRKKKRQSAISKSLDFYERSSKARNQGDLKPSILLNIRAIEAVKDYWSEEIKVTLNGKDVFWGNELITNQNKLIGDLSVKPVLDRIIGVRAKPISDDLLSFTLSNKNGVKQEGIPVLFIYSDGRISKNKSISDNLGRVSYNFKKFKSKKNNVVFKCEIDLSELIDEATSDYMLHKLLDKIIVPDGRIDISVRNPILYVKSNEKVLGDNYDGDVRNILERFLKEKGLKTTNIKTESDFEIIINSDTKKVSRNSDRVYTSELIISIKMLYDDEIVYSTSISEVYGRGSNYKNASIDAYSKVDSDIRIKVGNQLYRYILD